MARTQVPVRVITRAGQIPGSFPGDYTAGDHANGMYFVNADGLTFVEIYSAEPTLTRQVGFAFKPELASIDTVAVPDRFVTCEPGSTVFAGPFPPLYDQDNGTVNIDPDAGSLYFRAWQLFAA